MKTGFVADRKGLLAALVIPGKVLTQCPLLRRTVHFLLHSLVRCPRTDSLNKKCPVRGIGLQRGRDSNPRNAFGVYTLSRRAPSTTRTPLCEGAKIVKAHRYYPKGIQIPPTKMYPETSITSVPLIKVVFSIC